MIQNFDIDFINNKSQYFATARKENANEPVPMKASRQKLKHRNDERLSKLHTHITQKSLLRINKNVLQEVYETVFGQKAKLLNNVDWASKQN